MSKKSQERRASKDHGKAKKARVWASPPGPLPPSPAAIAHEQEIIAAKDRLRQLFAERRALGFRRRGFALNITLSGVTATYPTAKNKHVQDAPQRIRDEVYALSMRLRELKLTRPIARPA